ncbi:hypothetical protein AaE_012613, partial [Aphanomyces astaci]
MTPHSSPPSATIAPVATNDDKIVWRSAMLFRKGEPTVFGRGKWKPRYAVLTSTSITYYTNPSQSVLEHTVDLAHCSPTDIEQMPHDCPKTGHSASSIWRIAIQTPTRRHFIAVTSPDEMNRWFQDLQDIANNRALNDHHQTMDVPLEQRNMLRESKSINSHNIVLT